MLGLSRRFFAGLTALVLVFMWVPAAFIAPAAQASGVDGGFEIDGNKTVDIAGNLDWTSPAVGTQPVEDDNAGGDPTVYSASSKESNDPSTWTLSGGAPPKDDMTNIYGYAKPGTALVFFGFDRGATSGTDSYYLELNKLQPTNATTYAPNRSDGDLRFRLDDKGNGVIALSAESVWTSGAWVVTSLASNPPGFDYAVSADESFLEFSFDLTTLLDLQPACPPLFGSLGFRNVTGNTGENLKDFIKPLKLSAGSTCGQLKIVKHDGAGALLPGATFHIVPDPRPTSAPNTGSLDVLDNGPYDTDPADGKITVDPVRPGDYTVTEQSAPDGYFLDSSSASVTVPSSAANSPVPVFVDGQGSITVHKKTAGSAALGHSTFQLLDHATQAVVDTVADSDGDGTLVFSNVAPGTYDLHESVTPQGYDTAADVTSVVVDQDHQNVSVDVHDAQHETALTVHKTDLAGNTPISGATFDLWVESNGVSGLQTEASGQTAADTAVGFTCTTGATGFCTSNYTHATWPNTYYWKETGVPWPFTVPDSPNDVFAVPAITSANVTTTLFTVEAHDPMAALGTVASPSTTVDTPTPLNPTATIGDQATVSGIQQGATGTIDFYLYKTGQACDPNAPDANKKIGSSVTVDGPGTYPAQPITTSVSTAGTYHWLAVLHIGTNTLPGSCTDTGEQVIVGKATPTLTTVASNTTTVDGTINDVAHLRDFASSVAGETVHFALYTTAGCGGTAYWPTTASDGDATLNANGDATSPDVAVDGTHADFYWKVTYDGDANNGGATESCGTADNNEISHAPLIPTPVKAPASGVVSVDAPNNTIDYTITVQNTGHATATDVDITEPAAGASADPSVNVFDKATYNNDAACGAGTSAGCAGSIDVTGGVITWTTDIAAGSSATVSFSVTVKPTDGDGDHIYNQASVTSGNTTLYTNVTDHVVKFPEIRVTKASDPASGTAAQPAPVSPGDDITYTLTVHNDGLADATDVPVSDVVPDGTEYVQGSADATGGTFDSGNNTVSWKVNVAAGASVNVSFQAHVVETDLNGTLIDNTGRFTNTHTPADDCLSPGEGTCDTNTTHHEVEFAVLALAKTADPATGSIVQRGDTIDYTITVSNSGLAAAHQVPVEDTLPANVTLDESSVNPTEESNSNGKLAWLVDVPASQNGVDGVTTITYTVTVDATAPEGATLTNAVLIDGECPGAPEGSDPCTTDHHVPTGALTLVKHVDKTSASYGDTLTYTFDAATTGDLDQTSVVVRDTVPAGTTYTDGSAGCTDAGPCTTAYDPTKHEVSWQLGDIAHGAPARHLVFKVTIDKPAFDSTAGLPAATITNSGVIVSGETAKTPSNEVKTTVIQVLGIKVVRKPPTLPFTGAGLPPVTAVAVASLMIAVGATLVGARRRED